ncbi:hypothetical protein FOL47_000600 [Perkinsus chesapeaki]|uniref:MULE transposase domain-containing protein n=1 Tax=Perkinsus chesapeaki TaxID=330153 RepID=A0A7J6KXA6_PERCH|nr:hypothetical protein FOL47_000600 [Perkinsus chesapeaki]
MAWLEEWIESDNAGQDSRDCTNASPETETQVKETRQRIIYKTDGDRFDSMENALEKLICESGYAMTSKGSYPAKDGRRHHKYVCTYQRRIGWNPCTYAAQIVEQGSTFEVRFAHSPHDKHQHKRIPGYEPPEEPILSKEAMSVVERQAKQGVKPCNTFRSLRNLEHLPPAPDRPKIMKSIFNKRSRMREHDEEKIGKSKAEIRHWCESRMAIPERDDQAYCLDYSFGKNTYFVFSTPGLLRQNGPLPTITVDFTSGLSWLGFKTLVCGSLTDEGQFRLLAFALTCNETTEQVAIVFSALRRHCEQLGIDHMPTTLVGDSADTFSRAYEEDNLYNNFHN